MTTKCLAVLAALCLLLQVSPSAGADSCELAILTASDGVAGDRFGYSVSLSGDLALVGAYEDDDSGVNSGSAFVYYFDGKSWTEEAKLLAADGANTDWFGWAVALDGDTALVGAYGNDDHGDVSGSAYVYRRYGTVWSQEAKLTASDAALGHLFGQAVALDGDTALIASSEQNL